MGNSAAYITGRLRTRGDDKNLVIQAANRASNAVDLIMGVAYENGEKEAA
jgi:hypothetical protein